MAPKFESPDWKKQERQDILDKITFQLSLIDGLQRLPRDEMVEEMLDDETGLLNEYRADLKLLRENGDEYGRRYKT